MKGVPRIGTMHAFDWAWEREGGPPEIHAP